jgi:hypothetical protein
MTMGTFYYDNQLKRYVNQFCAIFQQMQVQVGKNGTRSEPGLIDVPIIIGPLDRVAAAAATGHTQNRPIRIPMMSAHLSQYQLARDRMKGTGVIARDVYVPIGGTLQDDGRVVYQRQAVPYDLTMELYIYTSNKDQQFQILEQIFVLFDPSLQIQTSDGPFDRAKIVTVELTDIGNEENFPPGTEAGNIVVRLTFKIDAYIEIPADVKQNLVKQIILRVSAVNDPHIGTIYSDGANNNQIGDIYDVEGIEQIIIEPKPID